jgi:hypothetical protein
MNRRNFLRLALAAPVVAAVGAVVPVAPSSVVVVKSASVGISELPIQFEVRTVSIRTRGRAMQMTYEAIRAGKFDGALTNLDIGQSGSLKQMVAEQ